MKKYLLILTLTVARVGIGDSMGLDVLSLESLSKRDCSALLKTMDAAKIQKIGYLWGTFTKSKECTISFLDKNSEKEHVIRVHATNETCRRGSRRCESSEINHQYTASKYNSLLERGNKNVINNLRRRIKTIKEFFNKHSNQHSRIIISTGLEDNFTKKAFLEVLAIYREELYETNYSILRNPLKQTQYDQSLNLVDVVELHSFDSFFINNNCVFSNDGVDIDLLTSRKPIDIIERPLSVTEIGYVFSTYISYCRDVFLWWNTQGVTNKFIPPKKRTISLNHEDLRKIKKLIRRFEK